MCDENMDEHHGRPMFWLYSGNILVPCKAAV